LVVDLVSENILSLNTPSALLELDSTGSLKGAGSKELKGKLSIFPDPVMLLFLASW